MALLLVQPAAAQPASSAQPTTTAAPASGARPATTAAPASSAQPATTAAPANPHVQNPHAQNPHAQDPHAGLSIPRDSVTADASIPKGTIVASIVDPSGSPLPGTQVRLGKMFQSISQGDQRDSETKVTNTSGEVTFAGLATESNFSYRISVERSGAEFASTPFQLPRDTGQRVVLHVYPVTRDIKQARIAMRGLVYVEPRDDVFQFELWFQVYNVSTLTWVPSDISIELPEGSKAFTSRESMTDTRFEADGDSRARMLGTYSPGQHDVRFGFQVPNEQDGTADFYLTLPPHLAEFRVITQAAKGMTLSVRDYPPVQDSTGVRGERVLVTQKRGQQLNDVHFQLAGLPTRGQAPWLAVMIAAFIAGTGLYSAKSPEAASRRRRKLHGELKRAQNVILNELVELEAAKAAGRVGPKSYEQTRRALMTALARIVQPSRD